MIPFLCTRSHKFIIFQFKILHRILCTNSLLYKCKLKETQLCTFCNESKETVLHLFWDCSVVKTLWLELSEHFQRLCGIMIPMSHIHIILGSELLDSSINLFFVLIKYYIYSCRIRSSLPSLTGALNMLKQSYNIEKLSASFYKSPAVREKIEKKWNVIKNAIN